MHNVSVALGERSYDICIGDNLLQDPVRLGARLGSIIGGDHAAIFTNPVVNELYGEQLLAALRQYRVDVFVMPDGEAHKSLDTYAAAMDFLMTKRHNRNTCLLALGGGVVGDLTGFVAATYQRGVDFVQIPTTLLAQVDSSVGGKTAVNHPAGKNMIGAFYQPRLVIADTDTLASLPPREYAAGLAEVVKYGVIADADLFNWLEQNTAGLTARDPQILAHAIARSCEIKAEIVAQDEREGGVRALLNFGHTFGHAIEKLAGYGVWLHGEAVAIGMAMAAEFSVRLGRMQPDEARRLTLLLRALHLPVELVEPLQAADMMDAMGMDKKAQDGRIRFIVANGLGTASILDDYDGASLRQSLAAFGVN